MKPTTTASKRTRNRLKEHRNLRTVKEGSPAGLDFQPSVLVECAGCGWRGWLPLAEIN